MNEEKNVAEFWKWKANIVYYYYFKDVTTGVGQFPLMTMCLIFYDWTLVLVSYDLLSVSYLRLFYHLKIGSEGSFLVKKKSNSVSVGEFYRDPALQHCSPNLQRHSNSLVS